MTNKTIGTTAAIALAVLLAGSQAFAGAKWGPSLVITSDGWAGGNLTDALHTADATQLIGCQVGAGASSSSMFCFAQDAAGVGRSCTSSAPALIAVAGTIEQGAYLRFWHDASGECTWLDVFHYSAFTF